MTSASVRNTKLQNLMSLHYSLCFCICWQPWPESFSVNLGNLHLMWIALHKKRRWSRLCKKVRIMFLIFTLISFMKWEVSINANQCTSLKQHSVLLEVRVYLTVRQYKMFSFIVSEGKIHQLSFFKFSELLHEPPALTFIISAFCPQCSYVFCVDLGTNSDYFSTQH